MNKTKVIYFFLFLLCGFFVAFANQQGDTIVVNGEQYLLYEVEKSEGFFRISQKFNVSQQDIIKANPEYADGIKLGAVLKIPIKKEIKQDSGYQLKTHEVLPGETVYSLSKKYNVSVDEIYKINPQAEDGIKVGEVIVIEKTPLKIQASNKKIHIIKKKDTLYKVGKQYNIPIENILEVNPNITEANFPEGYGLIIPSGANEMKPQDTIQTLEKKKIEDLLHAVFSEKATCDENAKVRNHIKLGILLPFMLNEPEPETSTIRFIEFYQGVLIAVDSLRKTGLSVDVFAFDTQKTEKSITNILANPALKSVDLIIGPAYSSQIKAASDFSIENNIPLIIPFSSKSEETKKNPYLFQNNMSSLEQMTEAVSLFYNEFKGSNLIVVYPEDTLKYDKKIFVDSLKNKLTTEEISNYHTLSIENLNVKSFDALLKKGKQNVIILATTDQISLMKAFPFINALNKQNLTLFGFPELSNLQTSDLYFHNTFTYSPFKLNIKDIGTKRFLNKYQDFFGSGSMSINPNYAILGYDIAFYFLTALQYGNQFYNYLDFVEIHPLQSDFSFKKVDNLVGYINTHLYLINYPNL